MVYVAFVLGVISGCLLTYELIIFIGKIRVKHKGDEHVE